MDISVMDSRAFPKTVTGPKETYYPDWLDHMTTLELDVKASLIELLPEEGEMGEAL